MLLQELLWCSCPFGQFDLIYFFLVSANAQVEVVVIGEEVGVFFEEFGDEFFHVAWVGLAGDPLFVYAFE